MDVEENRHTHEFFWCVVLFCVFFDVAEKMAKIGLEGSFVWAGLVFEDVWLGCLKMQSALPAADNLRF